MFNNQIDSINNKIYDWWYKNKVNFGYNDEKTSKKEILPPSLLYDLSKDAEILFVGLNPGGNSNSLYHNNGMKIPITSANFINNSHNEQDIIKNHEEINFKKNLNKSYSKIFHDISNDVYDGGFTEKKINKKNVKYSNNINQIEHIDLFNCRGTDSKQVISWIKITKSENHGVDIFKDVLTYLNKIKVVVFNNINSSNIIYDSLNPTFNKSTLTHQLDLNGRNIDIIFQGMITSQRSIDKFSYIRLIEIIKNALNSKQSI